EVCYQDATTPWDRGQHPPGLEEWMAHHPPGTILVPGCGRGHDARQLARYGFGVTAIDLSSRAVDEAQKASGDLGIEFVAADLFALPEDWAGRFDYVWEHTCFCAIHPSHRPDYVRSMHRVLQSQGQLGGLFFIHEPEEVGGPPYKMPRQQLLGYFHPHFAIVREKQPQHHLEGRENQEVLITFSKNG
ncbi:MAG: methyltransferase domain-containing protein, partial [Verrucomicrobiae bacterium]|nr:methyltransferase domain-containing protein [Verrucomicrobiae bacterium]